MQWESQALQLERGPCSLQLEKACTKQQRPSPAPKKFIKTDPIIYTLLESSLLPRNMFRTSFQVSQQKETILI